MAQKPSRTKANQRPAKTRQRKMGEPDPKRAEQPRSQQRPLEGAQQDLSGHRRCNGRTVERVRVFFADELPECTCCGEPWCKIHSAHYADCACIGPHNAEDDGWKLVEREGVLYAERPTDS